MKRILSLAFIFTALLALGLASCAPGAAAAAPDVDLSDCYIAATVSPGSAVIAVYDASMSPITSGISVDVNGTECTFFAGGYIGAPTFTAGDEVTLTITGTTTITQALTCPGLPVVTAPASGTYDNDDPLNIEWTYTGIDLSGYGITVAPAYATGTFGYAAGESFGTNTHSISGGTLLVSTGATVAVSAQIQAVLNGAIGGSRLVVANLGTSAAFNIVD